VFNLLDVTLLSGIEHQLLPPGGAQLAAGPYSINAVQVLDWRMPMEAGQYQVYAEALFGAAADALLAPPMQDES